MAPDSASNFCSAPVLYFFPWYFFLFRTLFVIATIHFIRKTRFSVDNTYRAFMRWAPTYKIWYRKHCLVYLNEAPPSPHLKNDATCLVSHCAHDAYYDFKFLCYTVLEASKNMLWLPVETIVINLKRVMIACK